MTKAEDLRQWGENLGTPLDYRTACHFAAHLDKLAEALKASQTAIREMRLQGAPTAMWDDVEDSNVAALLDAGYAIPFIDIKR